MSRPEREQSYYLWNIGCQMNRADARRVGEALERRGFRPVKSPREADLILLNTCVVRQKAQDRVVGRLSSLRPLTQTPGRRALLVMGCFVDDPDKLSTRYPFVDAFFAPSDIAGVVDYAERWGEQSRRRLGEGSQPISQQPLVDMVAISHGCDRRCTYCIVAVRRGRQRSRPVGEIVSEVSRLVARGAREITLLGQNVDAYGSDLPGRPDLAEVLSAVNEIDDLWRIRFLTSHPRDMTRRIIDAVAALPKVCKCWELALQSGDDQVLRRMGRGYTIERFRELVCQIRTATPDCAINTDVIVGFAGETEAQFQRTVRAIEEFRFDVVHNAAYSVRPGTPAALWVDDVPAREKARRRAVIEEIQVKIASEINAPLLGQEVEILVDGRQRGRWRGRTRKNRLVFFESERDWLGRIVPARITWTGPWSMQGTVQAKASQ